MAGHLRPQGVPVCPSLPSPPPSPPPGPASHRPKALLKTVASLSDIPIPPDGHYRRKNPNWRSPERDAGPAYDRGSLVPTLLDEPVEEDTKERVHAYRRQMLLEQEREEEEERARAALGRSPSFDEDSVSVRGVARALSAHPSIAAVRSLFKTDAQPAAGLYNTPEHDITLVQRGARKLGLHAGVMHKPRTQAEMKEEEHSARLRGGRPLARDSSWWMVVGEDPVAVNHLLDLQREHVASGLDPTAAPGALVSTLEPYNLGTPRGVVFSQLLLASALGGAIMFYGLSSL